MSLFDTGVRPVIDQWLLDEAAKERDYGNYWSASSAGYCQRRVIFERLKVPHITVDARKQRVFSSGHIFHEWIQGITKKSGLSIAQELELQDEELMIRGHIDDLVLVMVQKGIVMDSGDPSAPLKMIPPLKKLILYDYKTAHSKSFTYAKGRPMSYYHKMQLGTYMYMLKTNWSEVTKTWNVVSGGSGYPDLTESRILSISKDDLRMDEKQLLWSDELEAEVTAYWKVLNTWWESYQEDGSLPKCTCADHENGFLAREAYNPYFYNDKPCSVEYFKNWQKEQEVEA